MWSIQFNMWRCIQITTELLLLPVTVVQQNCITANFLNELERQPHELDYVTLVNCLINNRLKSRYLDYVLLISYPFNCL